MATMTTLHLSGVSTSSATAPTAVQHAMIEARTGKGAKGLRRIVSAAGYSLAGLQAAYRNEAAFRQEIVLAVLLVPTALASSASRTGKALMIGSVLLVLIVELINSAIEAVVDRVSGERHPLSKQAKDIGSAAVALALSNAVVIWLVVLWPN